MGIKTPNPFWLASAPPTNTGEQIMRAFDAGWGGAVWKTIGEPVVNTASRYSSVDWSGQRMMGLNNIELISDRSIEDNVREIDMVRDQQHPENTEWKLANVWPYWDVPNDYAIVSRILDTTTNRPVLIAAGITDHGTLAAGELITNPEYFAEAVPRLPRGWQKRNLQIVLRVPLVNRVAGRPRVLATHVW